MKKCCKIWQSITVVFPVPISIIPKLQLENTAFSSSRLCLGNLCVTVQCSLVVVDLFVLIILVHMKTNPG